MTSRGQTVEMGTQRVLDELGQGDPAVDGGVLDLAHEVWRQVDVELLLVRHQTTLAC